MGVSEQYSKEIRANLSYFPAWQPGDQVAPGDVGTMVQGVFHRQTTLKALFPDWSVTIKRDVKPNVRRFRSAGAVSLSLDGGGSVPEVGSGSVKLGFSRAGAVVFDAVNCTRRFIDNLHETRSFIAQNRSVWPSGYVLVSDVEEAERFAVFMSGEAGQSLALTGNFGLLRQFKLTEGEFSATGSVGYQSLNSGPILLRVYGFGWWSGDLQPQSAGDVAPEGPEREFQEVSAHHPDHD